LLSSRTEFSGGIETSSAAARAVASLKTQGEIQLRERNSMDKATQPQKSEKEK